MMGKIIKKRMVIFISFSYILLIGISYMRPMIMKGIMDEGIIKKNMSVIMNFAVFLIILMVVEESVSLLQTKLFADLQNKISLELYGRVGKTLFRARQNYFLHNNSTEIVNRLMTDIESVSSLVDSNIMHLFGYVFKIISGVIGLIVIDWKLALLVLVVVPVKYSLIKSFSSKEEKTCEEWISLYTDFSAWLGDTISGIREVKLWNLYSDKQNELLKKQQDILEVSKKSKLIQAYNISGDSAIHGLISAALYGIGGYFICKDELTLGSLTAFIAYTSYVVSPISLVMNLKIIFAQVKPSMNRLKEFLKLETEKKTETGKEIQQLKDKISFAGICFSYSEQPVIKNVNFEIHKGEKIAIIGENGSGKSTLISLLLRFIEPQKGCIFIDGADIKEYDIDQYRNLFGVVNQNIYLFEDTLWNNVILGKDVCLKDMEQEFERMDMQKFVEKLPNGYESRLEKNGENLSGGERQKIGLLRAIIKDSPILILDEATSNIDKKYDKFLHDIILNEFSDKTIIIITHKRENLEGMQKIYQMEGNGLTELL